MNQKLQKYKKKFDKIIRTFEWTGISIFLLGIVISITQYTINKSKSQIEQQMIGIEDSNYTINLEQNAIFYQNNLKIDLNIKKFNEEDSYKIIIKLNNEELVNEQNIEMENEFNIELLDEGRQSIDIIIYKNDEENYNKNFIIYYIKPYKKQFIDELSNKSIQVHYIDGTWEKYENSLKMINYMRI